MHGSLTDIVSGHDRTVREVMALGYQHGGANLSEHYTGVHTHTHTDNNNNNNKYTITTSDNIHTKKKRISKQKRMEEKSL